MRKNYGSGRALRLLVVLLLGCLPMTAMAQHEGDWFYLVKTEPSDPAREAEFNAWYDDIDIPDVLAVPSFKRARRAVGQVVSEFPSVRLKSDDGKYVALYDIATGDIDKSIIDLYVAARKMSALGRLTDVLRVVEANYYRRVNAYDVEQRGSAGQQEFVYIQKILCCNNAATETEYRDWFGNVYVPAMRGVNGLSRIGFYELYRIMEELAVGPEEIPHRLAVYEIAADSATEALAGIQTATKNLEATGRVSDLHALKDSLLYLQMSDVRSD